MGKYQKQLLKVFISLGFLFVLFFTVIISFSIKSSFKNQYRDTLKQSVSSNSTLSQVTLSTISSAMNTLIKDSDIKMWSNSTERSQYYYYSYTVARKLHQFTSQFSMIPFYPAVTRLESDTLVISPLGSSNKEDYFKNETTLTEEDISYIFQYFSSNSGELTIPTYQDNQLTDIYYIQRENYSWRDLLYIIKIPKSSLFGSDPSLDFILYNDKGILAYNDESENHKKYWENKFTSLQQNYDNKDYHLTENSNNFIFSTGFSRSTWKIAYSYDNINLNYGQILFYILLPFVLLSVTILIFFRKLSSWLYLPIKEVVTQVMDGDFNPLTEMPVLDEFQLLKKNATTVKQLATELQHVMNQNSFLITQRLYKDLLFGLDTKRNPLYEDFQLEENDYCVSLIEFQEPEDSLLEHDIFFCKNTILTATGEQKNLQYVNISSSTCAVIIQTSILEDAIESMIGLSDALPATQIIKIAVSDIRASLDKIHNCFIEAEKILEYKYLYSNTEILTAAQVFKTHTSSYHYPVLLENRLIQQVAEGRDQALTSFDNLIRENFIQRDLPPELLRNFIYTLLSTLTRIFQEVKISPENLLSHGVNYEELYKNWSHPNIISTIRSIIEEIITAIKKQNANSDSKTLKKMENYIYEHYSRDIMLNDMADALCISPKYCSNLFKKLSDDTFKNFLNRYRIEQAKLILEQNPKIKISDLGLQVGFNSANTFIRVFGKYTGMTPKSFANKVGESFL